MLMLSTTVAVFFVANANDELMETFGTLVDEDFEDSQGGAHPRTLALAHPRTPAPPEPTSQQPSWPPRNQGPRTGQGSQCFYTSDCGWSQQCIRGYCQWRRRLSE